MLPCSFHINEVRPSLNSRLSSYTIFSYRVCRYLLSATRSHDKSETKSRSQAFTRLDQVFFLIYQPPLHCYQHPITAYFPHMFSIKKIFLSFSKKPVKPVEPVEPVRYRFHHDRNARPLKSILKHPQPTTRLNTQISFAEEGYVRDPYTRAPYNRSVWRDEEPLARDPFQPSHGKTLASHPDDTSAGKAFILSLSTLNDGTFRKEPCLPLQKLIRIMPFQWHPHDKTQTTPTAATMRITQLLLPPKN